MRSGRGIGRGIGRWIAGRNSDGEAGNTGECVAVVLLCVIFIINLRVP